MAIYSPNDIANMDPPRSLPDALVKGGYAVICRSAPYLAGYAFATGNLPAGAAAASIDIACGLPLIPIPDYYPPIYTPIQGGGRPVYYRVTGGGVAHNANCERQFVSEVNNVILGPISVRRQPVRNVYVSCLQKDSLFEEWAVISGEGYPYAPLLGFAELGDYLSVSCSPVDGLPDLPGLPLPVNPPLPPGTELPPGWPDAPRLPGYEGPVPYLPPGQPPGSPPLFVPIIVPPVILPIKPTLSPTFNVPITAPINIPVSLAPTANVSVSPSLTIQIDPDGNIRTPPDLICECPSEPGNGPPPVVCPATVNLDIPLYVCTPEKKFESVPIVAIASSVPGDLFDRLLSSSNLAEIGCESLSPTQANPTELSSGSVPGVVGRISYVELLNEDVVRVQLRIFPERPEDFRQTKIFEGTGQRLFAVMSWCLYGGQGGENPVECWDMLTEMEVPRLPKRRIVKLLLKPGLRWELWDTGLRL